MPFVLIAIGFVYTKTVYTLTQVRVFTATLQWIFHNELFSRTLNFNLPQREVINNYDAHFVLFQIGIIYIYIIVEQMQRDMT